MGTSFAVKVDYLAILWYIVHMISLWEKNSFIQYDFIVIGGGIVGLSTAISLKERHKKATVLVLERGMFPSGASTKNAGFACFGSPGELLADIDTIGEDATLQLVQQRWEGLQLLRNRLGDKTIDFQMHGGYSLLKQEEMDQLNRLDTLNETLYPLFEEMVFSSREEQITSFGFPASTIKGLIYNPLEGQLDTGKMMKSLQLFASQAGVEILTGAEVSRLEEDEEMTRVFVESKYNTGEICFRAGKLAICTNAFSKKLLPALELQPGRGLVMVTSPIPSLKFKGVFHYEEGYFYFRNFGNSVIFGGGRNHDLQTEESTDFDINKKILNLLMQQLEEIILPGQDFVVDQVWTGIMAFGPNKLPICRKHSDRIGVGIRLGGMGIAIGSQMGLQLAELLD